MFFFLLYISEIQKQSQDLSYFIYSFNFTLLFLKILKVFTFKTQKFPMSFFFQANSQIFKLRNFFAVLENFRFLVGRICQSKSPPKNIFPTNFKLLKLRNFQVFFPRIPQIHLKVRHFFLANFQIFRLKFSCFSINFQRSFANSHF